MEPTASTELFAIKDGLKAVDVALVVQVVREPVNIFSNSTGRSYRILEVHAASSRGDVIKVTLWNEDIDRLSPFIRQGALLRFTMFKAQKVTQSSKFRIGTFDIALHSQRTSSLSIAIEKFRLQPLPLSSLSDIDMSVKSRHRLRLEISQKFVSSGEGLIGYGILCGDNWAPTNVTAQIILRHSAPLLRYILAVKNRVLIEGTVGRSGSMVEVTANSIKDVELAKSTGSSDKNALLPCSSKSVSSTSAGDDRIFAKQINEFAGDNLSGYVVGVVMDLFSFEGESFKGELMVEDEEAATLPVTLTQVAATEGQSFVTDAVVQIHGLLQYGPDRVLEFAATADGVRFVDNAEAEPAASEKEIPLLSSTELFRMAASSIMGVVEGMLIKTFTVSNDVAAGMLRVKGPGRSLLLKVSLQFDTGAKLAASFERGSHLRLTGVISREKENSSFFEMDVMFAEDVCLLGGVDSPYTTPFTTPKEADLSLRSRLSLLQSTSVADPPSTPISTRKHTGNSPVKQETSTGLGGLLRKALFEDPEHAGKRRSEVLRELYNDNDQSDKKKRVYNIDSDSDSN